MVAYWGFKFGSGCRFGGVWGSRTKEMADAYALEIWHTATLYLFIHGLGLLALGVLQSQGHKVAKVAGVLQAGIVIFSGTLYAMALGFPKWLGAITPIGGTLMIVGWLMLVFGKWAKS